MRNLLLFGQAEPYWQKVKRVLGSSLLAHWELKSNANDYSGNARNAVGNVITYDQNGCLLVPANKSNVNPYSVSLKNAFSGLAGSVMVWFKVSGSGVWSDGSARYLFMLYAATADQIYIVRSATNGRIDVIYRAGSTASGQSILSQTNTDWMSIALTWDKTADEVRVYLNGIQYGSTLKSLGLWTSTSINSALFAFGAFRTDASLVAANVWDGWIKRATMATRAFTPGEVAKLCNVNLGSVTPPNPGAFSIVFIPDTGNALATYPSIFAEQTQWIADNQSALNIQAVLHSGDVVHVAATASQWTNADAAIDILDTAEIPYLISLGNHDYNDNTRDTTAFAGTFPQSRYTDHAWWNGGFFEDGHSENSWFTLEILGITYLFLNIEIAPRADVLVWAKSILAANPEKPAIITTHAYMYYDGTRISGDDDYNPKTAYGYTDASDGEDIWTALKAHDNIIWIQSGHEYGGTGASRRQDMSDGGTVVNQILCDPEGRAFGGNGYLRIVQFDPVGRKVQSFTYSPVNKMTLSDDDNLFEVAY